VTDLTSRRGVLKGTAGAAINLAMTRLLAAKSSDARKFTMDLVCGNLGVSVRLPEAIGLARRHGFESVAPDAGFLRKASAGEVSELLGQLKESKLVWGAAGLPVDFRGDRPAFESGLKNLTGDAAALRRAGVTRMGTWIMPVHDRLTYLANFKQHADRLRAIGKVLADHEIRLGLEYVGPKTLWSSKKYPFIHTMAESRELISAIGQPGIGLVLDSWHWYTAHEAEADLLSLKGDDVICCDLNDAPAGMPVDQQKDQIRDLPCATGVIDLKSFLGALVKIGYDGPVRAEPFKAELRRLPAEEAVARTARAMKQAFALLG
jgi:sugar phosphate isomerase/epimerase